MAENPIESFRKKITKGELFSLTMLESKEQDR
jgi:hypothetical protein